MLSTKSTKHNGDTSKQTWEWSKNPKFMYFCDNETVHGVEWDKLPTEVGNAPYTHSEVPIVCDMSSNFLSRRVDVRKYAFIYGGAQKNIGPAGVTICIVRDDMLELHRQKAHVHHVPPMFDYLIAAENNSMYNTPPTFSIYMAGLGFEWMLENGGVNWIENLNAKKSSELYDFVAASDGFYTLPVKQLRSRMNIPIRISKGEESEKKFLKEAEVSNLLQLAGHRRYKCIIVIFLTSSVGGLRVSLYNAMSMEGVQELLAFMKRFQEQNMAQ